MLVTLAVITASPTAAAAQVDAGAAQRSAAADQHGAAAGFEKLKSLAGEWRSVDADGRPVDVSYEVVSGGAALLETLAPAGEPTMVTVYHLDGDELALTHYCSGGNQPRLRAAAPPGEIAALRFTFLDATSLAKPTEGHIHALTLTFHDDDHVTQAWTWQQDGKALQTTYGLERRRRL
jgi:hypothetical protein